MNQETKKKAPQKYKNDGEKYQVFRDKLIPFLQEAFKRGELGPERKDFKKRIWHTDYNMFSSVDAQTMWSTGILTVDRNNEKSVRDCFDKVVEENTARNRKYKMDRGQSIKENFLTDTSNSMDICERPENIETMTEENSGCIGSQIKTHFKKGSVLYSPAFGEVIIEIFRKDGGVLVRTATGNRVIFNKDGKLSHERGAEVMIYPDKAHSDAHKSWDEYRPYNLNDQPVRCICVFKKIKFYGIALATDDNNNVYVNYPENPIPTSRKKAMELIDSGQVHKIREEDVFYDIQAVCDEAISENENELKNKWVKKRQKVQVQPVLSQQKQTQSEMLNV